jgi:nitronate monooxygenase
MPAALDVRSLDAPIVQAGMGAVARHELAAAVSEAGGLGTIAGARAPIAAEIAAARRLTGRPIAVNLLLPFVRSGDAEASAAADVIVTFWGHAAPTRSEYVDSSMWLGRGGDGRRSSGRGRGDRSGS